MKKQKQMKGAASNPVFLALSIIGVLLGVWLTMQGMGGKSLGPGLLVIIGIFVTIKEILDMIF